MLIVFHLRGFKVLWIRCTGFLGIVLDFHYGRQGVLRGLEGIC